MNPKKAQISTEIFFAIGVALLIFILFIPININRNKELDATKAFIQKNNECEEFSNALARVAPSQGLNVTNKFSFAIKMQPQSHTVDVEGVSCRSFVTFFSDIEVQKGFVEIRNIEGLLKVRNV